jgi:hypothetical protein
MAQSVRTITATLKPDKTCDLNVRDVLKPGFHEYAFQARWTAGLEYYSRHETTRCPAASVRARGKNRDAGISQKARVFGGMNAQPAFAQKLPF